MKNIKKYWYIIVIVLILLILALCLGVEFEKGRIESKNNYNVSEEKTNIDVLNEKSNNPKEEEILPKSYTATIPIYMYHWIKEDTGGYEYPETMVKPSELKKQFKYISTNNYDAIFISDIDKAYKYEKPIALTFDDGWQDVYIHAFPFAKEYNVKFSMYVIKDLIGTPGYCTEDELREMYESGLVAVESHTVSHRMLATLTEDEIYEELSVSKNYLKDTFGIDSTVICYPSGSRNKATIKIAKELGYKYGLAMDGGVYYSNVDDIMEISRIFATRSMSLDTFINYAKKSNVKVEW